MRNHFNRRQALAAFGSVSLSALLAACGSDGDGDGDSGTNVSTTDGRTTTVEPKTRSGAATAELFDDSSVCTLTAQETEGPYCFDADSIRSDIREDRKGTRLRLAVRVRDADSCEPLRNAVVDVWHCDALGVYSGFEAASTGAGGGPGGDRTDDERYLRGAQVTNSDGIVEFVTVYPGAYRGRTVHIHAKVHVDNRTALTTQFYFDDDVSVYALRPYSEGEGHDTTNASDGLFDRSLLLDLSREGEGYLGVISLDVQTA
jgi:protocatechuate 3,4-dioxygenase beta subunit